MTSHGDKWSRKLGWMTHVVCSEGTSHNICKIDSLWERCPLKYLLVIFDFVVVMHDFHLDDGCSVIVMVAMCFCVVGLRC
jgi:hypothetical protein